MHVVIAVSSGSDSLSATLESLASCAFPTEYQGTVLVENGPVASFSHFATAGHPGIPNLIYVHEPIPGKSRALNLAVDAARSGLLVFFDDDVRFSPTVLQAYATSAQTAERKAYFGGPHQVLCEARRPEWLLPYLPASATSRLEDTVAANPSFTGFMGFNWAAYAEDILRLGGFNVQLGPGSVLNSVGDETEMQGRLRAEGVRPVFVRDALVSHHVAAADCTPEWAIDRRYREGLWPGWTYYVDQHASSQTKPSLTRTRVPLWMHRLSLKLNAKAVASLFQSPQEQFDRQYELAWHRGFVEGYRSAQAHARSRGAAPARRRTLATS